MVALCIAASAQATRGTFADLSARADVARDAGRLDEARDLYQKALALKPGWSDGWWSLATIHYDRNAYRDAARAFRRVVVLRPQKGLPRVMLGLCEYELGRYDAALRHIREGKQLEAITDPQVRNVMFFHEALLLLRQGHFEQAQDELDYLAESRVDSAELVTALGKSVLRVSDPATMAFNPAVRELVERAGRAELMAARKQYDEARREYQSLAEENPTASNVNYACGRFLLAIHQDQAAISYFEREIANYPRHVPALLSIAAVKYRIDSPAGIPYAERAVKLSPGLPIAHYLLGLLLLDSGRAADAVPHLQLAERKLPQEPKVYFALGSAYAKLGRRQEAAKARARFAELNNRARPAESELASAPSAESSH